MITWDYYEALAELLGILGAEPAPDAAPTASARGNPRDQRSRIREMILPLTRPEPKKHPTPAPSGTGVRWALTGSATAAVQDMPVEVRDVDIFVRDSDFGRAREMLAAFQPTDPAEIEKENGHRIREFRCEIKGVPIRCFTAPEDNPYVHKLKEYGTRSVYLSTLKIPCLPIEAQMEVYQMTAQADEAKAIQDFFEELEKKKEQEKRRK